MAGITSLSLAYGRGEMQSVGLEALQDLRSLTLERVKLDDYGRLGKLPRLESLGMINCGSVRSLDFLRSNSELRHIALHGTVVEDNDLSPLDRLPQAVTRYVQPRKGYNRRFVDSVQADDC